MTHDHDIVRTEKIIKIKQDRYQSVTDDCTSCYKQTFKRVTEIRKGSFHVNPR